MNTAFSTQLKYFFKGEVKFHESLKNHTSFGIGGTADYLVIVKTVRELQELIALANDYQQPLFLLGRGTNLLVPDAGFRGVVVKLAGEFGQIRVDGNKITAGAACSLSQMLRLSIQHNLSGLEFVTGIPGSLGGAVFMNAGSVEEGIGSLVREVNLILPDGSFTLRSCQDLKFSYRCSSLAERRIGAKGASGEIITSAVLMLKAGEGRAAVLSAIKERHAYRMAHQPIRERSAGCIFKNPPGLSAGQLIDQAGLKGLGIGGAQVSDIHANFIINRYHACSADVLRLIDYIQSKIFKVYEIVLEPEISLLGGD